MPKTEDTRQHRRFRPSSTAATSMVAAAAMLSACFGPSTTPDALCRNRQSEAKQNLDAIVVAQEGYLMGHDKPTSSLSELGVLLKGTAYRYAIVVDGERWYAEATGTGEQQGDVWRADEASRATNTVALCATLR